MDAKQKSEEEKSTDKKKKDTVSDWDDDEVIHSTPVRKRKTAPLKDWSDSEVEASQSKAAPRKKLKLAKKKNDGLEQNSQYMVEDETDDSE